MKKLSSVVTCKDGKYSADKENNDDNKSEQTPLNVVNEFFKHMKV